MRVESNHRSEAQNLVYLPLYDTSITLTQELKLIISRKLVGSLLLTVGRKEVWKTSSIYDLLLYCCGSQIRTDVIWLMRPSWYHLQSIPLCKIYYLVYYYIGFLKNCCLNFSVHQPLLKQWTLYVFSWVTSTKRFLL